MSSVASVSTVLSRAGYLFHRARQPGLRRTDRLVAALLSLEWAATLAYFALGRPPAGVAAILAWAVPVFGALVGGGVLLCLRRPGRTFTRHFLAATQILASALLATLSGGRIEGQFYLLASLALLALYRDWRVLATASAAIVATHALVALRPEYAAALLLVDLFLVASSVRGERESWRFADQQARAESTLDRRYETLVNSVDGVVWESTGFPRRFTFLSRQVETLLGYPVSRWFDEPNFWEDHLFADDRGWVLDQSRREIEAHRTHEMEYRMIAANGHRVWVRDRVVVVTEEGGPVTLRGVMTDITELKKMDRLKQEFVSTVSHELRTPLTSIHASLGLLSGGMLGRLPEFAQELIEIASSNSERLVRLVNDILDIDKMEIGKMSLLMKPIELEALLGHSIETNAPFAARFGVRFERGTAVPGARVRGDFDRLVQVLTNLLSNAAKFSPPNGVVTVSVARNEKGIRISVRDRGKGIPREFHPRIFQKFAQADTSSTRQKGGSGLGLAIAKAIVERHGGKVGFDTHENWGTIFWFDLPECPAPAAAGAPPAEETQGRRHEHITAGADPAR